MTRKILAAATTILVLSVPAHAGEHKGEDSVTATGRDRTEGPGRGGRGQAGFLLELGNDRSLRVMCGAEGIAECMEAVRPIIDQLPSLANRD